MKYYLAVDIGASSGRHMLGRVHNGKLVPEEIYRFENGINAQGNHLIWDTEKLFQKIVNGLRRCSSRGKIPFSISVDTWGVDYVLLDKQGKEILPAFSYRDGRGTKAQSEVEALIPSGELYAATGISAQPYNTIYQLWHDKQSGKLDKAAQLLMLPDYFHWRLTGEVRCEYTIATTTGLVNAHTQDWDWELIKTLGYPKHIFGKLHRPGETIFGLRAEIAKEVGFDCNVVLPGTHDTASAVAACPCEGDALFISSGTWSLMGTELDAPLLHESFTNEGGANGKVRFLRNIMGLWILQQVQREQPKALSYQDMEQLAKNSKFEGLFNVQDKAFLAPKSMTEAVRTALGEPALALPDVIRAVYHSLATCYANTAKEIETITGKRYDKIHIIGGGSDAVYLNDLTAQYSGKAVLAGPKEATAIGNLLAQLVADGTIATMEEGRNLVRDSIN